MQMRELYHYAWFGESWPWCGRTSRAWTVESKLVTCGACKAKWHKRVGVLLN